MSEGIITCPKCESPFGYFDGSIFVCPECAHEWNDNDQIIEVEDGEQNQKKFLDAHGVELQNGDTVRTIKELKVGGETLKSGTKVKNIRLLDEEVNGHDISCKVEGYGSIYLKCSVVKKD